jgi:hypothetical protein
LRRSIEDKPMCTIIDYRPINMRNIELLISNQNDTELYSQLFNDINIFDYNDENIWNFIQIKKILIQTI